MSGRARLYARRDGRDSLRRCRAGTWTWATATGLYWEDWGNPDGTPVLHLHGGPGAPFGDSHKALFPEELRDDPSTLSIALLETHYFSHGCFVPENNIPEIRHIPCLVIQGRFDMCTPAISAYDLARAYGDELDLRWVNSGHLRTDPEMFAALRQAAATLRS